MSDDSFYFNVEEKKVESGPNKRGFNETRLGPFATSQEAEGALDRLHQRNAQLDEKDREWREG